LNWGWVPAGSEQEAYGINLLPMGQRMDWFEESVEVIARLLSQETTTFTSKYFNLTEAHAPGAGGNAFSPPAFQLFGARCVPQASRAVPR
jgi:alkanesulfonate monooxygenase SsuD/methylene tetrahydromethanopterin reductase-like flavin-dependent oxidoreductase (luciferase family)